MQMPSATTGGHVIERPYIRVVFQSGLPREVGVNGCRVEDVLDIALDRLLQYQKGLLACAENDEAIRSIRQARQALELRIRRRQEQGVLNTLSRHQNIRTEDEDDDFSATGA
ncbi:hypothetical protein OP10G_4590 [Fimbriimonas ginsengisoli Gsoil 348]|uniref:Acb2/Tad1 hairpin domain-containing protein n=2 Tax=Fimbriimonas ginsengisoli TaxID=1005039 RepID=A0A068NWR3_FIMGI|nr:hypothetical protein OP10G_4590 [Fimbriimonas ginsengisoli Gsoil 348]